MNRIRTPPPMCEREEEVLERFARLESGASEADHRRFMAVFLAALLTGLGATAAVNLVVNPLGIYPASFFPPLTRTSRDEKLALLAAARPAPEALVLGSSRSMLLDPATVQRRFRLPAFNLAVDTAYTEDYYALLRYSAERRRLRPRLVILGLDVEAFHDGTGPEGGLTRIPELVRYLHARQRIRALVDRLNKLVSMPQLELSLRSAALAAGWLERKPARTSFLDRGMMSYDRWDREKEAGTFALEEHIAASIGEYKLRFAGYARLQPRRMAYFEAFLEFCREREIAVIVFISPLHGRVIAALAAHGYPERKAELLAYLRSAQARHGFTLRDYESPARFGGDPDGFYDGAHIDRENSDRIIVSLSEAAGTAASPNALQ